MVVGSCYGSHWFCFVVSYVVVITAGDVGWFLVVLIDFVCPFHLLEVDWGQVGDSHVFGMCLELFPMSAMAGMVGFECL